jgi:lipoprotein-releasing system ATP-binding protein
MNNYDNGRDGPMTPGGSLYELRDLHKSFRTDDKEVHVLQGIRMDIRQGEALAILGASGVGKTTLLHILGTLDPPTKGQVLYRGEELFGKPDGDLAAFRNREIGFVFQFHYLLTELSALENAALPGLIGGQTRQKAEQRARGLLEDMGLGDRLNHRPGKLSGGEQQRVAVARAMLMEPRVILADEPTGNLDTRTSSAVEDLLLDLREQHGVTLVVVTHNPEFARRMDRQVRMVDGKIEEESPPGGLRPASEQIGKT